MNSTLTSLTAAVMLAFAVATPAAAAATPFATVGSAIAAVKAEQGKYAAGQESARAALKAAVQTKLTAEDAAAMAQRVPSLDFFRAGGLYDRVAGGQSKASAGQTAAVAAVKSAKSSGITAVVHQCFAAYNTLAALAVTNCDTFFANGADSLALTESMLSRAQAMAGAKHVPEVLTEAVTSDAYSLLNALVKAGYFGDVAPAPGVGQPSKASQALREAWASTTDKHGLLDTYVASLVRELR